MERREEEQPLTIDDLALVQAYAIFAALISLCPWCGVCRRGVALGAMSAATVVTGMLVAGGGVALAATMSRDPRTLTRSGMDKFRKDEVEASIQDFDAVIAAAPQMRPYMWQRGLSLYYVGEPKGLGF